MAAFNFPEPPVEDGTEVTNSTTGVTYQYDLANDCWSVITATNVALNYVDSVVAEG